MFAPRTHHRGGIRLELQVLGMEPRRYLLKVVHLVDVHVVVRSEEQEPLIGIVRVAAFGALIPTLHRIALLVRLGFAFNGAERIVLRLDGEH